ncbi:MAG TPA: hypothetical protein VI977_05420 [archaeon]|nr:hypothetical protein [archaeon]
MFGKSSSKGIALETTKAGFAKNSAVEFSLKNNSSKTIFVMPALFNELSLQGEVSQKTGSGFVKISTFNAQASAIDNKERQPLEAVEISAGESLEGSWSGTAYKKTGSDAISGWNSFQATGTFRIKIAYYNSEADAKAGKKALFAETEFQIK